MNRENKYLAFTLVEMLIVMGIIIVLMGVGITAGRFAINRANDVAHQNAVDQIYQGLQAYYTDNREFPKLPAAGSMSAIVGEPGTTTASLAKYMDSGSFDGGTEASYYYFVDTATAQSVLVCVTLGGVGDTKDRGAYCNGNGFNSSETGMIKISAKNVEFGKPDYAILAGGAANAASDWDPKGTTAKWKATVTTITTN